MKIFNKLFILGFVSLFILGFGAKAHAMVPTLSLSNTDGNNVVVSVYGDSSSSIGLYYNNTYGVQNVSLGSTNMYGSFSTNLSVNSYNINPNSYVYVMVNNQQSNSVIWPSYSSTYLPYNNVGVSVSNLSIPVGSYATLGNANNANVYVSSNSNSSVVSVSTSSVNTGCGTYSSYNIVPCYLPTVANSANVVITALTTGTSTLTLCPNNYAYNNYLSSNGCNTITVNVISNGSVLGASTSNTDACYITRILRYGSVGSQVSCLNTYLANRGYLSANFSGNSYFDLNTRNAVISFQRDNGLYQDGVIGKNTRSYFR